MATRGPKNEGGYDCEFVRPPPDYFQTECSVCLLVLREANITSCCGHNFCKECIERVQKDGKGCPLCNKKGFTLTYNRANDVALKQLDVYCTHRKIGCEWKGKLEMLDKHLNVDPELEKHHEGCAFVELQCWHNGCEQSFQRRVIAKHQSRECPQRPFSCEHCHEYESTYRDVTTNHWPVCECYPVSCPHKCTQNTFQRQNLQKHLNEECLLQEVECEFKYAGCETKLPRKDMPEHVSNSKEMVRHVSLLARQNQELTARLEKLSHHVQITPVNITAPVQIVMTDFEQQKRDKDEWYSEGFYTHPQGYKMCLNMVANGYGKGKGTHVSGYVYLMRGEFDNHLKWPFRGNVTVQLLNQREDNKHHTWTIDFNEEEPNEKNSRVTSGKRAAIGRGNHKFFPHSDLGYTAATNCQYLMNDCLYFRVKVELL